MEQVIDLFGNDITEEVKKQELKKKNIRKGQRKQPKHVREIRLKRMPFLIRCSLLQEVRKISSVMFTALNIGQKLRNILESSLKNLKRSDINYYILCL